MSSAVFDYIVIGAGSAGCVLAARLTEDPYVRVLVLEAGGPDDSRLFSTPGMLALVYQVPQLKVKYDWGYRTVPQKQLDGRRMPWSRGKILGGCSTVNGMLYLRGHRDNYDGWRDLGCTGWGYDDVLPYFKKSEAHEDGDSAFHGGAGALQVTRQQGVSPVSKAFVTGVSKVCGVPELEDFNGEVQEGASTFQMTCANRKRSSAARAFLHPAMERANLTVVTFANVTRIVVENGRAVGVDYIRNGERHAVHKVRAEREVILSAGAIGSPQLLMISGIGPADHLRAKGIQVAHDAPGVGKNLQDHLMVPLRFDATPDTLHTSTPMHFIGGMLKDLFLDEGWMGKTFLEGGAFVRSSPSVPRPDMQFHSIPWAYPEPNDDEPQHTISTEHSYTMLPGIIYPKSRGEITLDTADPLAAPIIDPRYCEDDDDMKLLVHGVRLSREIAATDAMKAYLKREAFPGPDASSEEALRAHVRLTAKTIFHPVGTCKMGVDAASVVDPTLRVRGIEGLRVVDASVMPTITGGNTNAPTIMIGEKAADMIRARGPA